MDDKLEKRITEVINRHEIWQVIQRYGRGLDRIDVELTRSCYFEDAVDDHGIFIGLRDEFIEWANGTTRNFKECHHGVMNHYCELDGDAAYCETYYLFIGVSSDPPHLLSMGRYIDHFQRRDGEWRIASRVDINEKLFDLQDSSLGLTGIGSIAVDRVQPTGRDRNDVSYHRPPRPRSPVRHGGGLP